jgi:uncharacterized protein YbcI
MAGIPAGQPVPLGGPLNAAIARDVVRTRTRHLGRGPTKAQSFHRQNVIVVVMEDTMTKSETMLESHGKGEVVLGARRHLRETMRDELIAAVEVLTGRHVVALLSADHLAPDVATEVFILDGPVPGAGSPV